MLEAEDKLNEAAYFLQRMRESVAENAAFKFNLSAFLSAARSITWYLQRELRHRPGFDAWYEEQQARMAKDERMVFFNERRQYSIHEASVQTAARVNVTLEDTMTMTDSLYIEVKRNGRVVETRYVGPESPRSTAEQTGPRVEWRRFFPEYPDVEVIALCEEHLGKLVALVGDAASRFSQGSPPG